MITRKSSEKWAILSLFDVALIVIGGQFILAWILKEQAWIWAEPRAVLMSYLWAAAPFSLVWLWVRVGRFRSHVLLACLSGEALTLGGWLWFFRQGYLAKTGQLETGTDIGLGIVMTSLPLIVLTAMFIIIMATRGKMPDDEIL